MPDYDGTSKVTISPALKSWMEENMSDYLDLIAKYYPPTKFDTADVFNGVGSRAFLYLRLYLRTEDSAYLTTAQEYMSSSLANVNLLPAYEVGFLWGQTGVYALGAVMASVQGDDDSVTQLVSKVQDIFTNSVSDSYAFYDDFDAGRAGLLYAAQFLETFFGKKMITHSSVVAIGQAIVRRGQALSSHPTSYLEWISPNDGGKWLGTYVTHLSFHVLIFLSI